MAKAFSTVRRLSGKEPLLRRMVCEVRYRDGQLYLDHCGRLLKKLVKDGAWVITPEPTTKGTTVFHLVDGLQLSFSLAAASLDLDRTNTDETIEPEEAARFSNRVDEVLGFVLDQLEATQYERLGFRQWHYFSCESKEETEQWLHGLGLFSCSDLLTNSFQASPEAMSVSFLMKSEERRYRIALTGIERSAQLPMGDVSLNVRASRLSSGQKKAFVEAMKQKRQRQINSSFAAVLDIDTYCNDPAELDLGSFVNDCVSSNLERFRDALPKENGKKAKSS